ncbi:MAG: hypothetical protein WAM30_17385 [Candidatus Dormiibacterota bacterium]
MRSLTAGRLLAHACLVSCFVLVLVACSPGGPSGPAPASVALQRSDVPGGWVRCAWSGAVSQYIAAQRRHAPSTASELQSSWTQLRRLGATSANTTGYAAGAADCDAPLGHGAGATALSWVVQYGDDAAAHRGYEHGVLGFPTPTGDRSQAGLLVGIATGLGTADAWTLTQTTPAPPLYLAWWREGALTTYLLVLGISESLAGPIALRLEHRMQ